MSTVDIDKQIEDFVAEYYHRWVKWGYYGNPEKLDEDTEYTQACDFIKNLLSTQRTHLKAELLAKMPNKLTHYQGETERTEREKQYYNTAITEITKLVENL